MSENTVIEYPTGLSSIPYASFLEIQKFSYEEAQKYAAENFNDALGSLGRSAIARKVDQAVDGLATVYGSGDTSTEKGKINLYQTQYKAARTSSCALLSFPLTPEGFFKYNTGSPSLRNKTP